MVVEPYTVLTLAPDSFPLSSASGRVVDSEGKPMSDVTVSTQPHGYIAFTDSQGQYHFDYLPSDDWDYNFIATAPGYRGNYQTVFVPAGGSVTLPDIVLTEAEPGNRILFTEDFDTDLSGWDDIERPGRMYITHNLSHSGSGCLEMEFRGGPDEAQAGWMHHWVCPEREGTPLEYEGTETIYIRWYQRWSSNLLFKGHDLYALSGSQGAAETDSTVYVEVAPEDPLTEEPSPTGHPLVMIRCSECGEEGDDYRSWRIENVTIERDRWYCFEILATMNEPYNPVVGPSQWNGTIRFWLDGEELLNLSGLFMRHGLLTAWDSVLNSYSKVMVGPWYHGGVPEEIDRMYSWIDDMVVANYRVGPLPEVLPTINITLNQAIFHPGDTMVTTVGLKNPSSSSVDTLFVWYFGLPDQGYWTPIKVMPLTLLAGFDESYDIFLRVGDWAPIESNATWYVALLNATTYEIISDDRVEWRYMPSAETKAKREITITPSVIGIAGEIKKAVEDVNAVKCLKNNAHPLFKGEEG